MDEIKPLLELAFREGGNGVFLTISGGIFGLVISALLLYWLYLIALKSNWPNKRKWAKWCRVGLLIYSIATIPLTAMAAGAGWGLITAVINVVNHEQWIEKASEEGLNHLVGLIITSLEVESNNLDLSDEEFKKLVTDYTKNDKVVNLVVLNEYRNFIKDGLIKSVAKETKEKFDCDDTELVSRIGSYIANRVWTWIEESKVEHFLSYFDNVIKNLESEESNTKGISFAIGEVLIKPHVDKKMKAFQSNSLILGCIQIAILLLPPICLVWLGAAVANRFIPENEGFQQVGVAKSGGDTARAASPSE